MLKNKIYKIIGVLLLSVTSLCAQKKQPTQKELTLEAKRFVAEGNDYLVNDKNFTAAEREYRKAIDKNPLYEEAKYNLGNAYYVTENYDEALQRFAQTGKTTDNKQIKHLAFHNQGNTFMRQKKYDKAIAAYKNALRNNPLDNETRYNLALAKKMREKDGDQDNKDKNKDDDKKDNKSDKKEGDKEGKDGEDKKEEKEGKNKKENKKEDDKKEDKKEGDKKKDGEDKEDEKGKPNEDKKDGKGDAPKEQQPPKTIPGQLSQQQVKSLLEAMNNQEKKVQEKINAKKVKGGRVQTEKDW